LEEDPSELPTKKQMVSKSSGDKKKLNWWRLVPNPARHNEYFMLELSGLGNW